MRLRILRVFGELLRFGVASFVRLATRSIAASGDNGAFDDGSSISVDYPASDPHFIAVGGTTLLLSGV